VKTSQYLGERNDSREVVIGSLSKKYVVAMQSILRKKRGDVSLLREISS
jgi:hypothetical protein